jgi:hypothetical protein
VEDTPSFASMNAVSDRELHFFPALKAMGMRTEITGAGFGGIREVNWLGHDASLLMVVGIVWQ